MSDITPPLPPSGVPLGNFPWRVPPYNNITPLTYRDGESLLEMYKGLRHWLFKELVPYIDTEISIYVNAFNAAIGEVSEAIDDLHEYVDGKEAEIDVKIAAFDTKVENANEAFDAAVTAAMANISASVDAAVVAQHAAEAARDLAEQYAQTAGQQVDANVSAFISNAASLTRAALETVIHGVTDLTIIKKSRATISVQHRVWAINGKTIPYARAIASVGGFVPYDSGFIGKVYGSDFDVTNPNSTGTAFKPPGESLNSYAFRTKAPVVANASGWNVTNNIGEMRGAQIHNGLIYHEFEATNLAGSPAGVEALGLTADGRLKCYSALRGDTAASMVAAGVKDAWSYGPNLVIDGVAQDLTTKNWQYFLTEISARTIIGQRSNGDVVIISTVGKTNLNGITGNEMVQLAVREGLYNASTFDGGGSTQLYAQGFYTIPSSDTADGYDKTFGRRGVGDCFYIRGELATAPLDTGWRNLDLRAGYGAYDSNNLPQVRALNGVTELRGVIKPSNNGTFGADSVMIADMPQQFGHETSAKSFLAACNGENIRKITVQADRSIQVVGQSNTPTYVALDGIRWGTQTL